MNTQNKSRHQHSKTWREWIWSLFHWSFYHCHSNSMELFFVVTLIQTRTTRTPAFWGYPPPPHDYPYHWVILDPKSKKDKVKDTNLKNSPKFQILKRALHATHLLKLLDKMCKYEMDLMSIVVGTERTRFCPQTDRRTDRRTRWYQCHNHYTPPLSTSLKCACVCVCVCVCGGGGGGGGGGYN